MTNHPMTLWQMGMELQNPTIRSGRRLPAPYWFHPFPLRWCFLDHNIARLVNALNLLPGIRTLGSCGGHENPNSMQQPLGKWFISFRVSLSGGGWRSLEMIANLQHYFSYGGVTVGVNSHSITEPSGRGLWFAMNGDGSDPDEVASKLRAFYSQDRLGRKFAPQPANNPKLPTQVPDQRPEPFEGDIARKWLGWP